MEGFGKPYIQMKDVYVTDDGLVLLRSKMGRTPLSGILTQQFDELWTKTS